MVDCISSSLLLGSNHPSFWFVFRQFFHVQFPFIQIMVRIMFQSLYQLASSLTHDFFRQEANPLSLSYVLMQKNGRDLIWRSHTSRLYPGLYAVIKTMSRMQIQLLCACVLYSMGSRVKSCPYMGICDVNKSHGRNARFWLVEKNVAALWLVSTPRGHYHYWFVKSGGLR